MREFLPFRAGKRLPELAISVVLATGAVSSSSCGRFFKKEPRAFNPPPITLKAPPPPARIGELPEPPEFGFEASVEEINLTVAVLPSIPAPPPLPQPAKPKQAPPPAVAETPVPPAAPKPVQIITAEQQRAFLRELDESLDRVKGVLALVSGKNLGTEDNQTRIRIETLRSQAEERARLSDLATAVEFARRADALARDLYNRHR
jgi:hypothetical protein